MGKAMTEVLVVYNRATGAVDTRVFVGDSARRDALDARIEAERICDSNIEIVVLSAESEAAVRKTHSRYFHSVGELASRVKVA